MTEDIAEIKHHTWPQTLALHLIPGVVSLSFTVLAGMAIINPNLPPVLVFGVLTNIFVLIPMQMGWLYYLAKKRGNSGLSLEGVVVYRARTSWRKLLWLVPAVLAATFIVFTVFAPLTQYLLSLSPTQLAVGYEGDYSRNLFIFAFTLNIIFTAGLVPLAEELYFRGYLLPRMPKELGASAPIAHSFLFAIYHFETPWMIPVRTIGLLPLIYATRHTKSTDTGIITHSLANLSGVIESASERL